MSGLGTTEYAELCKTLQNLLRSYEGVRWSMVKRAFSGNKWNYLMKDMRNNKPLQESRKLVKILRKLQGR
jgi:hypothetical protein